MKKYSFILIALLLALFMTATAGCTIRTKISSILKDEDIPQEQTSEKKGAWLKTKEVEYDTDGTVAYRTEFMYDENGNEIRKTVYDGNGKLYWWYECEFDENNRIIKANTYDGDGSLVYVTDYAYDGDGNITMYKATNPDGSIYQMQEYEWGYYENAPQP